MRGLRGGTIAALLWLGLAVSVAPAQAPATKAEPAEPSSWWSGLFGSKPKEEPKKPVSTDRPAAPTSADRALEHDRLQNAYLRRSAVCLELRRIALDTNNAGLEEEAHRLEELAFKLYREQSARVLGTISTPDGDELDNGKPSRHSAAALGKGSPGGQLPGRVLDGGRIAPELGDQSASTREGER